MKRDYKKQTNNGNKVIVKVKLNKHQSEYISREMIEQIEKCFDEIVGILSQDDYSDEIVEKLDRMFDKKR